MMLYKMQLSSVIHHQFGFEKLSIEREIAIGKRKEHGIQNQLGESTDVINVIVLEIQIRSQ